MYAIAFDLKIEEVKKHYGIPYNSAYDELKKVSAISERSKLKIGVTLPK